MSRIVHVIIFCVLLLSATSTMEASLVQWPLGSGGNGHWYELVEAPLGWDMARDDAATRSMGGSPGYLATITTPQENAFIAANLLAGAQFQDVWLGGFQPAGSPEPGGNWQWITGEPWSYDNWFSSEPNNTGGGEDVLQIFTDSTPVLLGHWNDLPRTRTNPYIVEFVPEPMTVVLLFAGGTSLLRRKRATMVT